MDEIASISCLFSMSVLVISRSESYASSPRTRCSEEEKGAASGHLTSMLALAAGRSRVRGRGREFPIVEEGETPDGNARPVARLAGR